MGQKTGTSNTEKKKRHPKLQLQDQPWETETQSTNSRYKFQDHTRQCNTLEQSKHATHKLLQPLGFPAISLSGEVWIGPDNTGMPERNHFSTSQEVPPQWQHHPHLLPSVIIFYFSCRSKE
ncbi:hypothetical protein SADUNF_Sadunf05G0172200 [Salix dunnii]|uniref:Uncharacterized protein n=1 Tax=Salix dunnii TaxID=1413687 RepID=A0A835KDK3_9ROSI|nr:hypothetical protein SADUNF_Sadunf05G0172200 [Salix dunnii]